MRKYLIERFSVPRRIILSLLLCSVSLLGAFAQVNVKGTVLDETGEGVIGASVVVKGNMGVGTVTDLRNCSVWCEGCQRCYPHHHQARLRGKGKD